MTAALFARIAREKRLILVPLVVAVLVNAVMVAAVVVPLSRRVAGAEAREAQSVTALRAAEQDRLSAASTQQRKARAEQDLKRLYGTILPAGMSDARRQTYVRLARLASDADLQSQRRIEELQEPKAIGQEPKPVLTRLEITMVLRGEYDSVRQFIRDIEASETFITIDDVSLAEGSEPGSPWSSASCCRRISALGHHEAPDSSSADRARRVGRGPAGRGVVADECPGCGRRVGRRPRGAGPGFGDGTGVHG